ncbi:zinc finger CCHC domain-containing protein 8 homolog [Thrips palmi]|uniref:Zinc finger CCHC domain-containing protein 8 homolog n=1 Tax=Thrips palmi TaxID=161013 RepID=A0A6P9A2Q9_THRPL|nr:zinc finger CCHC domain-containing protein 8 homolog [Thrips palmi]
MGESPGSPSKQEDGELSNDGDLSDLFVVDSTPTDANDHIDVPVYDKKFREVLDEKKDGPAISKPKRPQPPQSTCWNCGADHSLRDCTEPKNYDAINRNRLLFRSKQAARTGKSNNRYHLDDEQKFAHFRPGKISRQLQRALGLEANQLPRHVYRMRVLGYPPGWVEEARVSHSGLSLFNSDGQEVADPEDEDGEIVMEGARDKYDIKQIVEYPGFNCPCGPDIIDETDRLNSRPMAEKDSIKFMKKMWGKKAVKAYKRRKMNSSDTVATPSCDKKQSQSEDVEPDSDDAASSGEDNETEIKAPSTTEAQSTTKSEKRKGSQSPCSEGTKKQKLEDSSVSEKSVEPSEKSSTGSVSVTNTPKVGKVTSVTFGTPVIVTSEYTSLPSAEKFSKNICDVINFENLPDSTGKYEKMSGLLQKVRSFRSRLESQSDESEEDEEDGEDN